MRISQGNAGSRLLCTLLHLALAVGCSEEGAGRPRTWACVLAPGSAADFSNEIGCEADFIALASVPLDASIPGALSVKTVIDRLDGEQLYFQNSERYQIHWEFANAVLSGDGKPIVPPPAQFNQTEYYSPDRRFNNGAVTYYEGPEVWAYEIAPYDTANPFDTAGLEPGFYVNVQAGEASVGKPDPGVTTDQFIYHFHSPGQPIVFISHSSLIPAGTTVLTSDQTYVLGKGLDAIHKHFLAPYGAEPGAWYAMDVEFKFDGRPGEVPALFFKQARPHPGWGQR